MSPAFLNQVAEFIKLALDHNEDLQNKLYHQKRANLIEELNREKYKQALYKAADALYDSDFLDDSERKTFLRKAAEDPIYVVRTLEKVCEAADVVQMGQPARVTIKGHKTAKDEYDPVYEAAFGSASGRNIIDD